MAVGAAAEVKSKLSVVDVVSQTVQLKKSGSTYKGLCPFHGEKTASFYVTPARESWKCFGCGLGGDIFSFVMQRDSVTFPEALKQLAARAGVELDERTSRDDARRKSPDRRPRRRDRLLPLGPGRAIRRASPRSTTSRAAASRSRPSRSSSSAGRPAAGRPPRTSSRPSAERPRTSWRRSA